MKKWIMSALIIILSLLVCNTTYAAATLKKTEVISYSTFIVGEDIYISKPISASAPDDVYCDPWIGMPELYFWFGKNEIGNFSWTYEQTASDARKTSKGQICTYRRGNIVVTGKAVSVVTDVVLKYNFSTISYGNVWDASCTIPTIHIKVISDQYRVTINANGGTVSLSTINVVYNRPYSISGSLPIPTREGYIFQGWYTALSGGKLITDDTIFLEKEAMVNQTEVKLYAHWEPITFDVTYYGNAQKVSSVPETQKKIYGKKLSLSKVIPLREGYEFIGWGTNPYDLNSDFEPGDVYQENNPLNLYAKWIIRTYEISYDGNGEGVTNVPDTELKIHGEDITIASEKPKKKNAVFMGWSKSADSGIIYFKPGDQFDLNEDMTLFAVWFEKGKSMQIPAGTTIIEDEAFYGASMTAVVIPKGVRIIGSKAFGTCKNLKYVYFQSGDVEVAEDFIFECSQSLLVIVPAGSKVAENIEVYRQYLSEQ